MKKILVVLVVLMVLTACKKDDENIKSQQLINCNVGHLIFKNDPRSFGNLTSFNDDKMYFEYTDNLITKINGGLQSSPSGMDLYNVFYTTNVYDSIIYQGDLVYVYTKPLDSNPFYDNPENPMVYKLNSKKQLTEITLRNGTKWNYIYEGDIISQSDNLNDPICSIERKLYLTDGNLTKVIESIFDGSGKLCSQTEILFKNYDNNPNPFQNKYYILGAYYKAFSKNNYTEYQVSSYQADNNEELQLTSRYTIFMPIAYNENGYPAFGDYE